MISIFHLSIVRHLEWFPKCNYGFQDQERNIWLPKLKTFKRWVAMNFHGTKSWYRWFPVISGHGNEKIVIHGNWNPRAWNIDLTWDWLHWHSTMYYMNWYFENSNICVSIQWNAVKKNLEIFLKFGKINSCSLEYLLEV